MDCAGRAPGVRRFWNSLPMTHSRVTGGAGRSVTTMRDAAGGSKADAVMRVAPSDLRGVIRSIVHGLADDDQALPVEGRLAPFDGATGWLNSEPLAPAALRGRVVLVDFWTYTCVNWLRTLPYLRAWDAKYRAHGLVVIGAHTPEFGFEHDLDNVRRAIKAMRVEYPIAVDNDYAIWNGFSNQYWPALYLIDARGAIRFTHFGEGAYDESERMIQKVLGEAGASGLSRELVRSEER